ncbi:hypothetical protein [Cohnella luojiensis]|uniref:Uncharacterized protein n=1 Tax=Cohnella luojiensis TaxID=652876 RepID=A0A4Y8LVF5_9BACL|nr:hypothetical protein [Cohnella luojiensis]TFE24967.1 hypothetical protein E2980_14495 [Cohnella luojiensis]
MGTFLDQRSSMNSNSTGSIAIGVTSTPSLTTSIFGRIGLQTQGVPNPIVDLTGTIGLSGALGLTALIQVTRNGVVFYTAQVGTTGAPLGDITSFTAQDLLAPAAAEIVYEAAVVITPGGGPITRVGPEVFWGIASSTV